MNRCSTAAVLSLLLTIVPPALAQDPPVPLSVEFRLGDAAGAQGSIVDVPFYVRATGDVLVRGFSFSIDFDETLLQVDSVERVWERAPGGPGWEVEPDFETIRWSNEDEVPGNSGIAEGNVHGAQIIAFGEQIGLPVGEDVEVYRIRFRVSENAPDVTTSVAFMDGAPRPPDLIAINYVSADTSEEFSINVTPELAESFLFVDCRFRIGEIVVDFAIFRRGDADGDGELNLGDPITIFNYLFLGMAPPPCPDAADVDDDGVLAVTDGIVGLNFLFLGGDPPPSPGPYEAGLDPTPDGLHCERLPTI